MPSATFVVNMEYCTENYQIVGLAISVIPLGSEPLNRVLSSSLLT